MSDEAVDGVDKGLFGQLGFRLQHVGVAVPALGPTTELMTALFGYRVVSGPFDDPIQKVSVNFLTTRTPCCRPRPRR